MVFFTDRSPVQVSSPNSARPSMSTVLTMDNTSSESALLLGALQRIFFSPKIRDYYGSGWVGSGLTRDFFVGKSSQNSRKPVVIFWSSIPCVFCLYMHC